VRSDRQLGAALALCAALVACDAPTVPAEGAAYDPTALTGFVYHWGPGRSIAVYVDPTAEPASADLRSAVSQAMSAWRRATFLGEVQFTLVDAPADADVIVRHSAAPRRVGTAGCQPSDVGAGGYTFFCVENDTPQILPLLEGPAGRVKMDIAIDRTAVDDDAQFRAVVAHELGHVLGIGAHSSTADDLMFPSPRRLDPSVRDAQTLRSLFSRRAVVAF
jgi:predicted Zn-dependent protease